MTKLEGGLRRIVEGAMDGAYHGEQVNTAVRQLLDIVEGERAAGYREGIADAANRINADLSLFDEGMNGIVTVQDFVHVYKRRSAAIFASLAPAAESQPGAPCPHARPDRLRKIIR